MHSFPGVCYPAVCCYLLSYWSGKSLLPLYHWAKGWRKMIAFIGQKSVVLLVLCEVYSLSCLLCTISRFSTVPKMALDPKKFFRTSWGWAREVSKAVLMWLVHCISFFPGCYGKITQWKQMEGEKAQCGPWCRVCPRDWSRLHCVCSGEAEDEGCLGLIYFLLFYGIWDPSLGNWTAIFRWGFMYVT